MKILAVDDDLDLLGLIAFALRQAGYLVVEAQDGPSALSAFEQDLRSAREVTREQYARRSWWRRMVDRACNVLAPLL